ncbi:MAG: 30S ribosomal protein S8e [Candidatus Nanoarchaeia archaeon]
MAISQQFSRKKPSGAGLRRVSKKRKYEMGRLPTLTKLGEKQVKRIRVQGGNSKDKLLKEQIINVFDPKSKKAEKATIKTVVDNKANRNFIRRNILTKGTVVDTDKGQAKVTNRPGQEGTVNGVLTE